VATGALALTEIASGLPYNVRRAAGSKGPHDDKSRRSVARIAAS
jgi:hypothetical protein